MRQVCCNTSSFRWLYHANRWDLAALYKAVANCSVDGVIVEERYFNERGVWWARKGRDDLRKLGVDLVAIGASVELFEGPSDAVEEQTANLMEWARIAALSEIPCLEVEIQGPDVEDWSVTAGVLEQAARCASGYGTLLVLRRTCQPDDRKLLNLARSIGHRRCRLAVASCSVIEPEMHSWIREAIVRGDEEAPPIDPLLVCVEPADPARAVEEIRDTVAGMRRRG
jgi:hypothetical protein